MSEQALDVRTSLAVLRRHARTLTVAAGLGVAAGTAWAVLQPPTFSSVSLVFLPPAEITSSGQPARDVATQVRIASSGPVLMRAGRTVAPPISASELGRRVSISAPTGDLIEIRASAPSAPAAERLATGVAGAYVAYVLDASSAVSAKAVANLNRRAIGLEGQVERLQTTIAEAKARLETSAPGSDAAQREAALVASLQAEQSTVSLQLDNVKQEIDAARQGTNGVGVAGAKVIQRGSSATRTSLVTRIAVRGLVGLALALVLVAIPLLVRGRRDRRLRSRDDIENAVGSPLLGSLRSQPQRTVSGWIKLFEAYDPGTVDGWTLRKTFRRLGVGDNGREVVTPPGKRPPVGSLIRVLAFADDPAAAALAAQMASYAASIGMPTIFVAGSRHASAATLTAACASAADSGELRPGLTVRSTERRASAGLTVVLTVVDRLEPTLTDVAGPGAVVLSVSAGAATTEDLARLSVTADDLQIAFDGILLADPDPADRSTGQLTDGERTKAASLPTRLTGLTGTNRR